MSGLIDEPHCQEASDSAERSPRQRIDPKGKRKTIEARSKDASAATIDHNNNDEGLSPINTEQALVSDTHDYHPNDPSPSASQAEASSSSPARPVIHPASPPRPGRRARRAILAQQLRTNPLPTVYEPGQIEHVMYAIDYCNAVAEWEGKRVSAASPDVKSAFWAIASTIEEIVANERAPRSWNPRSQFTPRINMYPVNVRYRTGILCCRRVKEVPGIIISCPLCKEWEPTIKKRIDESGVLNLTNIGFETFIFTGGPEGGEDETQGHEEE